MGFLGNRGAGAVGRALCVFNAVFVLQRDGEARVSEISPYTGKNTPF